MKSYDCEQLSAEWFELRRGRPTASQFGRIITAKTMKLAAAADEYIAELLAETYHVGPLSDIAAPPSRAMLHGTNTEPEARAWYSLERNVDVQEVGFVTTDDGRFGASPDGLMGVDGGLELKCPQGKTQVGYLLAGELPSEYRAQCHGQLIVTGRKWVDFLSYCPGLPPLLVRVEPDGFTEALRAALDQFWDHYQTAKQVIERLANPGQREVA